IVNEGLSRPVFLRAKQKLLSYSAAEICDGQRSSHSRRSIPATVPKGSKGQRSIQVDAHNSVAETRVVISCSSTPRRLYDSSQYRSRFIGNLRDRCKGPYRTRSSQGFRSPARIEFLRRRSRFEIMQRLGESAAFLAAGGYHHHIGLNTWESLGGSPPAPGTTGLYHTAIVYPDRPALAGALRRVLAARIPLEGAADHGVRGSIYLRDPDDNGVELYCDKPPGMWPRTSNGQLAMFTRPLDLHELLKEA